jgi:hypothetical protein
MNRFQVAVLMPVALAVFWLTLTGAAAAQVSIAAPAPQQDFAPAVSKFRVDRQGNLPAPDENPTGSNPPAKSTLEIPQVPKEFEGCWEGTVTEPDSWQVLEGPRLGGWIPSRYRLCFRRTGDGPFTMTFHDTKLDTGYAEERGHSVTNYDEQTELVSTDGKNVVSLHSVKRLDERMKFLGLFPITVTVAGTSDSRCVLVDEGSAMNVESSNVERCSGSSFSGCNGQPWIQATWHSRFNRTTNTNP